MVQLAFFLLALISSARAEDCDFLLRDGVYKSVLRQIQILNPAILTSSEPAPVKMYLDLKRAAENFKGGVLSDALEGHLRETQLDHYHVDQLSREELAVFYRNALYALLQRAANLWRQQEVRSLAGRPLSRELESFAMHLLDSFFSPNALNDQSLSSREAQEYFRRRPWIDFDWNGALGAVEDWLRLGTERSVANLKLPESFDWNQQNRIRLALSQGRRPGACCLSEPGCTLCPHNRGARRR
ncbi:MAG: hypothetical protein ACXVA9_10495 [Bdellovibrionales bacterium]